MKTRRRLVRERIRRNKWRRARLRYDINSIEIRVGGVLLTFGMQMGDWLVRP